jgi:hypothetical protein
VSNGFQQHILIVGGFCRFGQHKLDAQFTLARILAGEVEGSMCWSEIRRPPRCRCRAQRRGCCFSVTGSVW